MGYRRVVTGHSPDGSAIVASDTEVPPITSELFPGLELRGLWGADEAPTYPDDGSPPPMGGWFPPVGGFRFNQMSLPPDDAPAPEGQVDQEAALAQFEEQAPGLLGTMEPENPGFHTSDTVDVVHVVSGSLVLELDDGVRVKLNPGDTVVQSGTRHAWRNPGTEPCTIVGVSFGARRSG